MKRAALVLALLLAVPALVVAPTATAADPTPTAGSPHDPIAAVVDVAIADQGGAAAAVMGAPFSRGTGAATTCAPTDFQVYNFVEGRAYQGSSNTLPAQSGCREPFGRSHVAMNGAGNVVATLGLDRPTTTSVSPVLELSYYRVESGAAWNGTTQPQELEVVLPGTAVGLAVSQSGDRVVVAGNDGGRHYVRGYTWGVTALNLAFSYTATGAATALAATPDLGTIVVGASVPEDDATRGTVTIVPFNEGRASYTYYDRSAVNTTALSVAIAPDGSRFVAGGLDGRLQAFANHGSQTEDPKVLDVGAGNVTLLAMSGDGSRLAAAAGPDLVHYDYGGVVPTLVWNHTAEGDGFTDLAYNRTGGLLVAGIVGVGAAGFGEANSTPFWTIPGTGTFVDVDAEGTRAVVAQRSMGTATTVSLYDLTRGLALQYPNGGDVGQPRTATATEAATFEVQVVNEGAVPERVRFELANNGGDMRLEAVPPEPLVVPGQALNVVLKLTPTAVVPGDTTLNVTAVSLTSGLRDDITLTVRQQARVNVTLAYDGPSDMSIQPTDVTTLLLGVENDGNKDTAVGIRATQSVTQGQAWNVSVEPDSFTLAPNKKTTVRVTIVPPPGVANGTANTVTLSLEGQDVTGSASVTLRVNPRVGVSLTADSSARFVSPGRDVVYNLTLRNNGTLPREYEVYHELRDAEGAGWFAEVERGPYLLAPGANSTFQVRVFAPDGVEPGDRAPVVVTARSIPQLPNETAAMENITLYAIAVQPPTPTPSEEDGTNIPAPAAALSLTALLLVAVALRRRNFR